MSARERAQQTVTIAINTTDSTAINARGCVSGSFFVPSAFTGTAVTFKGSLDGTTWYSLYTASDAATGVGTVAVSRAYPIPAQCFDWPFIQIVASSQAAARDIIVSMNG